MADAAQYPLTTPYGYVKDYPLNNGFHQGIDYGCPVGTPVVVNGVTIGLSGATGFTTGPHLHVGRWVNGQVTNPGIRKGFTFDNAIVSEINEDSTNGKYVRVQADGASWVYLHLSKQLVSKGQVLEGEDMGQIEDLKQQVQGLQTELEGERRGYESLLSKANGLETELDNERKSYEATIAELKAQVADDGSSAQAKLEQIKKIIS